MKSVIVWFRNDLRLHDNPCLAAAVRSAEHVIPVFIFSKQLLSDNASNRNRFLRESLEDLKTQLTERGSNLIIRSGDPAVVLAELAQQSAAEAVFFAADYTPFATIRDYRVRDTLAAAQISCKRFPGRLAIDNFDELATKSGTVHKVFTPFFKQWQTKPRREVAVLPTSLPELPSGLSIGRLPELDTMTDSTNLSPDVTAGGETAARSRLKWYLSGPINHYHQKHNDMADDATSRLSPYLHFGCIAAREIETMVPNSEGAQAWHRQLAWREFYFYIMFHFPETKRQEFQERYRSLNWQSNAHYLTAWQEGKTGYPVVDAAMRQLNQEGWMHNRARLIVGSFLTKDLWLDWRSGEAYFMRMLLDGDRANNTGNWQWIASVGVDPAPVYRRLYNPSLQQAQYDPSGKYVRKYVPELRQVSDKYLAKPWEMPRQEQDRVGCHIGTDYPAPIVDHAAARVSALTHYHDALDATH
jgi:deoxyribodipyrimidine photo-lyase